MLWEGTTEVRIDDLFEHSWELDALYSYVENSSSSIRCQELIPGNNPTLHNAESRVRSKREKFGAQGFTGENVCHG